MSSRTQRSYRIPNLHGGISRQPEHIRRPNQVEDSLNTVHTLLNGASKRPGTYYLITVSGLTLGNDYNIHTMRRSNDEEYFAIYGDVAGEMVVRVFDWADGLEATVTIDSDAQMYLSNFDAVADDIRMRSIKDTTFIINTKVPADVYTILPTGTAPTVSAIYKDYDIVRTYSPAASTVYKTTEANASGVNPAGLYEYQETGSEWAYWERDGGVGSEWDNPNERWASAKRNPYGMRVRFQRQGLSATTASYTAATRTVNKTGAFANYTFRTGDHIRITGTSAGANTDGWYPIASKTDSDNIVLVDGGSGDPIGYDLTNDSASETLDTNETSSLTLGEISTVLEFTVNFNTTRAVDMFDVARRLTAAAQAVGSTHVDTLISWIPGSPRGKLRITSPYRGVGADNADESDSAILLISDPNSGTGKDTTHSLVNTSGVASPPFEWDEGTATAGTGTYVPSASTDLVPVDHRWESIADTSSPGASVSNATFPVIMTRTAVRSGSTPATFQISLGDWTPRLSGTDDTNPAPKFVLENHTISDVAIFQERLVIVAGPYIALSQTGELFNFYIEDVDNPKDSDAFERSPSSLEVVEFDFIAAFRQGNILFTKGGEQYEMVVPDQGLSSNTANIQLSTNFRTRSIRPLVMGPNVYFVTSLDNSSELREYLFDDRRVQNDAVDVSEHVEGLLPTSISELSVVPDDNTVILSGLDTNQLWAYRLQWLNSDKVMSSWTRWTFDASYSIKTINSLNSEAIMLVESESQHIVEKIPVTVQENATVATASETKDPYATRTLEGIYDTTGTTVAVLKKGNYAYIFGNGTTVTGGNRNVWVVNLTTKAVESSIYYPISPALPTGTHNVQDAVLGADGQFYVAGNGSGFTLGKITGDLSLTNLWNWKNVSSSGGGAVDADTANNIVMVARAQSGGTEPTALCDIADGSRTWENSPIASVAPSVIKIANSTHAYIGFALQAGNAELYRVLLSDGSTVNSKEFTDDGINDIAIAPDGNVVVASGLTFEFDGGGTHLHIFSADLSTVVATHYLTDIGGDPGAIAFSRDGLSLFITSGGKLHQYRYSDMTFIQSSTYSGSAALGSRIFVDENDDVYVGGPATFSDYTAWRWYR